MKVAIPTGAVQSSDIVLNRKAKTIKIILAFDTSLVIYEEMLINKNAIPIENNPTDIFIGAPTLYFFNFSHKITKNGEKIIPDIAFRAGNQGTGTTKLPKFLST